MPNGRYVLNDLEFENQIRDMNDRQLLEFTARQSYEITIFAHDTEKRVKNLEGKGKKTTAITGGAGSLIGAAIIAVINYFTTRG